MAEYSSAYTQNTTNITNGSETYKFSRPVSTINSGAMDNSCIYCGAEGGTVYDYFPTYEVNSDPAKKAAIDSLWTFGGGNFTYTANLKETDYNICFAYIADTGILGEVGLNTVYQIGKQIYNKANPESASNIHVLNPTDIRKIIFVPSFNGYASGSPDAQLVNKDIKYLIDHPDDFWVTSINMTSIMWDGTEYITSSTEAQKIRPCIVGKDYFLPVCNVFPTHHYDTTDYNSQKTFSQSYYGVYDDDGMPMSFAPIQANEALTYDPNTSYGGSKTTNNDKYYYNYNSYTSKVQLIAPARQILKLLAYCGCYFIDSNYNTSGKTLNTMWNDEHIYLGEMKEGARTTGNLIKGTDLLTSDTINKGAYSSQTNFDPSGGGGSGTPGEWDDMPGAGSSIGALAGARCYICSKTDITNLKNWMSKTEADGGPPDGYDVLSSLISVMAFPVDMSPASSGPATTISFTGLRTATDNQLVNIASALLSIANSVGATPKTEVKTFTSTATALPSAGNPFTIDLGTCTCPTFYSSDFPFADYDASVELYLPFIGTMSLDTQTVMGNSLHAYMSVDPITGAIYAWCECTKNGSRVVVASGAGAIGVNTPITANQVGMAMAQIKNNAAQTRNSFIQSAATIAMGAITGVDKNMSSILTKYLTSGNKNIVLAGARDYADALSVGAQQASMMALPNAIGANLNNGRANRQIAQANHNSVSGSAGGSTADWSCSYTPYLKIITPDVHRAGEQYEHTYGVPTILSGTLSTFKGLTFCANPDVSSISTATDQEKQQIFGLLAGGVYV